MTTPSRCRRLEDRAALVTGAGAGIGRAIALRLAMEGARVGIATLDPDEGRDVVAECKELGACASAAIGDMGDPEFIASAHSELTHDLGPADIVVNNLGVAQNVPLLESDDDVFHRAMNTNFMSAVRLTRLALPAMLERGAGVIANVGSAQGEFGWNGFSAYSASKGALMSWSRQLANEYGARGVRSNTVIPGATMTPLNRARLASEGEEFLQRSTNLHIIPRFGTPEEVAAAVAFLVSDDAAFITGTELHADGGTTVKAHWYP